MTDDRVREDNEKARTLITSALLGELSRRLLEYENAITWNTSCTSCAAVLDSSARETFRAEAAEGKLAEQTQARLSRSVKLARIAAYIRERAEYDGSLSVVARNILAIIGSEEESAHG